MKFLGVIPARYGSSRFEGKPLEVIAGETYDRMGIQKGSKERA